MASDWDNYCIETRFDLTTTTIETNKVSKLRTVRPLPCGLRTHRREFVLPILLSLDKLGGVASIREVLSLVEERMRGTLNEFDFELMDSGRSRSEPRWRNTARWGKDILVKLQLVSRYSPLGVWELTSKGQAFVNQLR